MADDQAPPPPAPPDRRWQRQPSDLAAASRSTSRRRARFFLLGGVFLALFSLLLVWLLLIKEPAPTPFFLSISIAEYNSRHYPFQPFTSQDSDRLARHFPRHQRAVTKSKELLQNELKGLAAHAGPLVVHIKALALVRENTVFLLPADAEPDRADGWIDVRKVIDAINACPAQDKLLILDLAQPLADARLGVLTDRVAQTLEANFTNEPPPFFVLCPCSAGQFSLTSEALQGSVFAYYLDQGLQGRANLNKDLSVTVEELFTYVESRVDRWAVNNRAVRQKPRLFGRERKDFTLVSLDGNVPDESAKKTPEPYPEALQKAWERRDEERGKGAAQRAPRLLRQWEASLLRLENRWRGGAFHKKDVVSLDDETQNQANEVARATAVRGPAPRSLAGVKGNPALAEPVFNLLFQIKDAGPKKDANAKIEEELVKKLQGDKSAAFPQQADAVIDALHRLALDKSLLLRPEHLLAAQNVLAALKPRQAFVELLYVRRLADYAKRKEREAWPESMIRTVWLTMRVHQAVLEALDQEPEFLRAVASLIKEADNLRRATEKKLLWEPASAWDEAFKELQSAKEQYEQAWKTLAVLHQGRRALDEAFVDLPAYMVLLRTWPEPDLLAEKAWAAAAREAETLQAEFARLGPMSDLSKLDTSGRELKRHLGVLKETRDTRISRAETDKTAAALQQLHCLLDIPLLPAPKRAELVVKLRTLAAALNALTETQDQEDDQTGVFARLLDAAPNEPDRHAGLLRAKMSLALLRLAGVDEPETKRDWTSMETRLCRLWGVDLVQRWHDAKPGYAADALNRVVSPWDLEARVATPDRDPTRALQRQQRVAFLEWLKASYEAEGRFLEAEPRERQTSAFYLEAAQKLRNNGTDRD